MSAEAGTRPESRTRARGRRSVLVVVAVLCLGMLLLRFVAEPMRVSSDSMEPTYGSGDEVLVEKLGARGRQPDRGDVVVVRAPDTGELVIKRVAALGGQTVGIANGVLKVDGEAVPEPYVDRIVPGTYFGPVRVPEGTVFVLGDHRLGSVDSRAFGPVPLSAILGKVVLRLWPP